MPERQRSKMAINLEILEAIKEQGLAKPTRILQRANLSHERMTRYLRDLICMKLVCEGKTSRNSRYYFLSETGISFLDEMKEKERYVSVFGLSL